MHLKGQNGFPALKVNLLPCAAEQPASPRLADLLVDVRRLFRFRPCLYWLPAAKREPIILVHGAARNARHAILCLFHSTFCFMFQKKLRDDKMLGCQGWSNRFKRAVGVLACEWGWMLFDTRQMANTATYYT